ncbi:MAG: hypothetical protein AB8B48_02160 [Pseudomonadales bacterium]
MEQLLASLKSRRGRPTGASSVPCVMFLLLLFSGSVFSANASIATKPIDINFERSKLQRYEQRIERLEVTIQKLRSQLELLAAEQDSLEVRVLSLKKSLLSVSEKYNLVSSHIDGSDHVDISARQRHADFEVYLAERKYNRVLEELNETQHQMLRTTEYLKDRIELLKRNRQGVVWQKQVLKKFRTGPSVKPMTRQVTERLAQAQ